MVINLPESICILLDASPKTYKVPLLAFTSSKFEISFSANSLSGASATTGIFSSINIKPKKIVKEFRVDNDNILEVGTKLDVSHFKVDQFVDASSISIGKGFAGVMKRHNFGGLRASHGVSISHRSHGSTGQNQDPGRVFKGKKMAGRMGHKKVTKQNLKIIEVDNINNILIVKGSVPGKKNSVIFLNIWIFKWKFVQQIENV